jgi:hypothetical protein
LGGAILRAPLTLAGRARSSVRYSNPGDVKLVSGRSSEYTSGKAESRGIGSDRDNGFLTTPRISTIGRVGGL